MTTTHYKKLTQLLQFDITNDLAIPSSKILAIQNRDKLQYLIETSLDIVNNAQMNKKLNNTVVEIQKFCTDICVHPFKYVISENLTITLLAVTEKDYAELERHLFLVSSLI